MTCFLGSCIVAAQILSGGSYNDKIPSVAIDSNDVVHNISDFYKARNNQFDLKGYLVFDSETRVDLHYDNGLSSPKRDISASLKLGVKKIKNLNSDTFLIYGLSTKLGGGVNDTLCLDDDKIAYFCETAGLWSIRKRPDNESLNQISVKLVRRF